MVHDLRHIHSLDRERTLQSPRFQISRIWPLSLRSAWSLAARLTVLYTGATFALLTAGCGFLLWVTEDHLDREDAAFLSDKVRSLRARMADPMQPIGRLEAQIRDRPSADRLPRYTVRLADTRGAVIAETPGMSAELPGTLFPDAKPASGAASVRTRVQGNWLLAAWKEPPYPEGRGWIVQIALDRTGDEVLMGTLRRRMAMMLLAGLLLAAPLGYVVARRGMSPVAKMATLVHEIRPPDLHGRIGSLGWPAELTIFASTFDALMERLEDSFARLSTFSADLAHELRTPLHILRGEAEVALTRPRSEEEYRHVLESSLEEYGRLTRLIDSLLFLARAERADQVLARELFDARDEAEGVLDYYSALAEEQAVHMRCDGQVRLFADPALVRRALSNLLSNALRHMQAGGTVAVLLKEDADRSILQVVDSGCGIAPEHLPHLGERFYRVDKSRARYPESTGLGLAITRSIMDLHGGGLQIESSPGQGTTVTLSFLRPDEASCSESVSTSQDSVIGRAP